MKRLAPASLLCAYACAGFWLTPYLPSNIEYITALETGGFSPRTIVHPLLPPTLASLKALLAVFGKEAFILEAFGLLNLILSVTAIWALFRIGERLSGSTPAALAGALLYGTSSAFRGGTLRADPYAFSVLISVAVLYILLLRPGTEKRRPVLLGILVAAAAGYHAACIALIPTVAIMLWLDASNKRSRTAHLARFAAAFAGTTALIYAVWTAYSWPNPRIFFEMPFFEALTMLESEPNGSLYTSGSIISQLTGYARNFDFHIGIGAAVLAIWAGLRFKRDPARRRTLVILGLYFGSYSGFFIINNTQNGLVFITGAVVPILFAITVSALKPVFRAVPVAVALLAAGYSAYAESRNPIAGPNSAFYREINYLKSATGPSDVLLVPGCPFDDIYHYSDFNTIQIGPRGENKDPYCAAPYVPLEAALTDRIHYYLSRGRRVLLLRGDNVTEFDEGDWGDQKEYQLFRSPFITASVRRRHYARIEDFLDMRFDLSAPWTSPTGRSYRSVRAQSPPPRPIPVPLNHSIRLPDWLRTPYYLRLPEKNLKAVFRANPEDPYAYSDLMKLYTDSILVNEDKLKRRESFDLLSPLLERSLTHLSGRQCLILAETARELNRTGRARGFLKRAETLHPDTQELRHIARLYGELGEHREGLRILKALLIDSKRDTFLWILRARLEKNASDNAGARRSITRALSYAREDVEIRSVAMLYQDWGDYARTLRVLDKIDGDSPIAALALRDRGVCEYLRGSMPAAAAALESAIRKDPTLLSAYLSLGIVYTEQDRLAKAFDIYQRGARAVDKDDAEGVRKTLRDSAQTLRMRLRKS